MLDVLGALGNPMTVGEVQARLPGSPAYTTVMTTLARMADKGALVQLREGRAFRYHLAAAPDDVGDAMAARQMRRLLQDRLNRAGVLTRFVAELDPDEERLLADLLATQRPAE